ncbi:MAG: DUF502 domain-containing protein [Pseudomonadota bacterium]|jgi:uncharacterized membrane protein
MTDPTPHQRRLFGGLRSSFLTGLIVVLPVGLTIYLIWTVIGWIDGWILPLIPGAYQPEALIHRFFGPEANFPVRGVGVIVFLVFTVIVGWIAKGLIGRKLIRWAEGLVDRMPVVRSLYNGLKQIAETVFSQSETNFERACVVEFPRPGVWAIGFVATKAKGELAQKIPQGGTILTVFVPTTPNPTSGFLVYVPEQDVTLLDMKIEDAAKLIISAGLVYPNPKDPTQPVT